ncbi:hypoxanthine phosphoribosyltransferase [Reichenbachiella carrageenanivorans]|uniref:Hypoxanthine phosphoribosyltransferase n=1 Tax=Reichenbachiella carrageenanivorans TaxID=2979869 RepID=A0ABY6D2Y5_9BACT|nr:hypoxanthine phosphoribosyltransferase [Reichenbachiella carrageenanivorans]UXX80259.1 hypoxanthine phosphoribosyltransferase [Reichenbachiella carrageenanivorans]
MIQIRDQRFEKFLSNEEIQTCIKELAQKIDQDYKNKALVILGILNGSFLFVADLVKYLTIDPEISFLKFASYEGTSSSGQVHDLIGINENLADKHLLIVEDIVDSGTTLAHIMAILQDKKAASIETATLFFKPEAYQQTIPLRYIGKEIPNLFVVGYGMDYLGKGRSLTELYQLKKPD